MAQRKPQTFPIHHQRRKHHLGIAWRHLRLTNCLPLEHSATLIHRPAPANSGTNRARTNCFPRLRVGPLRRDTLSFRLLKAKSEAEMACACVSLARLSCDMKTRAFRHLHQLPFDRRANLSGGGGTGAKMTSEAPLNRTSCEKISHTAFISTNDFCSVSAECIPASKKHDVLCLLLVLSMTRFIHYGSLCH